MGKEKKPELRLDFERIDNYFPNEGIFSSTMQYTGWSFRSKVPGGWFVLVPDGAFFYPDPTHSWDGSSLK